MTHYHSTCRTCLTNEERYVLALDTNNIVQTPGGVPFTAVDKAQDDADSENRRLFMTRSGHKQIVLPCQAARCLR